MFSKPVSLGVFDIECNEYMSYQYMPIKLANQQYHHTERRLWKFNPLVDACIKDFIELEGEDKFISNYVYLTVKSGYQRNGMGFNRPGWHVDGFGTDDENYTWSNVQPTVFNDGPFCLCNDEHYSMEEMEEQADHTQNYTFPDKSLIRMGRSVHKVGDYIEGHRIFFKLSFSKDRYNLVGNTHNYLLNYNWDMIERKKSRNVPQA
jgi:hypothetical protein